MTLLLAQYLIYIYILIPVIYIYSPSRDTAVLSCVSSVSGVRTSHFTPAPYVGHLTALWRCDTSTCSISHIYIYSHSRDIYIYSPSRDTAVLSCVSSVSGVRTSHFTPAPYVGHLTALWRCDTSTCSISHIYIYSHSRDIYIYSPSRDTAVLPCVSRVLVVSVPVTSHRLHMSVECLWCPYQSLRTGSICRPSHSVVEV